MPYTQDMHDASIPRDVDSAGSKEDEREEIGLQDLLDMHSDEEHNNEDEDGDRDNVGRCLSEYSSPTTAATIVAQLQHHRLELDNQLSERVQEERVDRTLEPQAVKVRARVHILPYIAFLALSCIYMLCAYPCYVLYTPDFIFSARF